MRADVRVARAVGRNLIRLALLIPLATGFLWVSSMSDWPRPTLYEPPWYMTAVPWFGVALYLIGLAWMVWIYRRSHVEPATSFWRYRL